jgi:hypothetical protein
MKAEKIAGAIYNAVMSDPTIDGSIIWVSPDGRWDWDTPPPRGAAIFDADDFGPDLSEIITAINGVIVD